MKKTNGLSKILSFVLTFALIAAIVLFCSACAGNTSTPAAEPTATAAQESPNAQPTENPAASPSAQELGEGSVTFTVQVTPKDEETSEFIIHTDAETVGEALLALGLIEGEESSMGLYVKTVNGITADYDTDGTYWAFYINGEYASTGIDSTQIEEGATYQFTVE